METKVDRMVSGSRGICFVYAVAHIRKKGWSACIFWLCDWELSKAKISLCDSEILPSAICPNKRLLELNQCYFISTALPMRPSPQWVPSILHLRGSSTLGMTCYSVCPVLLLDCSPWHIFDLSRSVHTWCCCIHMSCCSPHCNALLFFPNVVTFPFFLCFSSLFAHLYNTTALCCFRF